MNPFPPLYLVTDHALTGNRTQLQVIEAALRGGIRLVQYRDKTLDTLAFEAEAKSVLELCKSFGALMLINDHVEVAARIGADGVHLGQGDMKVTEARQLLGPKSIIGWSTHNARELEEAQELPVSYVNIGPMFPTTTKDHHEYPAIGMDGVLALSKKNRHPWTTMGGIKRQHLPELFRRGVQTVAMVTEITLAEEVETRTRDLLNVIAAVTKG